ncbi:MAG: putative protein of unknown function acetylesterase, partial [Planctomycetaceae bacterium]|nr:putative protein of unknown function acetylesterase [Planctomycetaceae bacterium]
MDQTMFTVRCSALLLLLLATAFSIAAETPKIAGYQTRQIAGWTVLVSDQLLKDQAADTAKALALLKPQLEEIVRVVPAPAVAKLRQVKLWFSPEYKDVQPRAEYHPGADWLRDNKRNPEMVKGVEFTNVRIFERETKRMPNFALHELSHAFHDQVLGFDNALVKAAYEKAKAGGLYNDVEQRFGDGKSKKTRAYALVNPMEYFAETSEALYSTNDFYPFTRDELAKHDPEMLKLLDELWNSVAPDHK